MAILPRDIFAKFFSKKDPQKVLQELTDMYELSKKESMEKRDISNTWLSKFLNVSQDPKLLQEMLAFAREANYELGFDITKISSEFSGDKFNFEKGQMENADGDVINPLYTTTKDGKPYDMNTLDHLGIIKSIINEIESNDYNYLKKQDLLDKAYSLVDRYNVRLQEVLPIFSQYYATEDIQQRESLAASHKDMNLRLMKDCFDKYLDTNKEHEVKNAESAAILGFILNYQHAHPDLTPQDILNRALTEKSIAFYSKTPDQVKEVVSANVGKIYYSDTLLGRDSLQKDTKEPVATFPLDESKTPKELILDLFFHNIERYKDGYNAFVAEMRRLSKEYCFERNFYLQFTKI